MHYNLENFTEFLKKIDLNSYRKRFSGIKTVEMDLPKNIQALNSVYDVYWNKSDKLNESIPLFDDYYEIYYKQCQNNINDFWKKTKFGLNCDCFPKGLKARIYRTWASLITQIHAGYVAEQVFGLNTVEMSTELDHKGIDILVKYKNEEAKIQIKKESHRPEIERMHNNAVYIDNDGFFNIWYIVPNASDYLEKPFYKKISKHSKKGELRKSLRTFVKFNKESGTLDRLENGFVIFTKTEFQLIKEAIDNKK